MKNIRQKQLELLRKKHYDQLYRRQPQLVKKLIPFLTKAEIIENFLEPRIAQTEPYNRRILIKELSKFAHSKKLKKLKKGAKIKKISQIRPEVLWNLR